MVIPNYGEMITHFIGRILPFNALPNTLSRQINCIKIITKIFKKIKFALKIFLVFFKKIFNLTYLFAGDFYILITEINSVSEKLPIYFSSSLNLTGLV